MSNMIKRISKNIQIIDIQEQPKKLKMAHGAMHYECEACGKEWLMWLEEGVEGKNKMQPCPFIIRCKCGGLAKHVAWNFDIHLDELRPINEKVMNYFALDKDGDCAKPILNF